MFRMQVKRKMTQETKEIVLDAVGFVGCILLIILIAAFWEVIPLK